MSENAVITYRRTVVASYLVRGKTLRYIASRLPQMNPPLINHDTGSPWSLATIKRDVDAIKTEWAMERLNNADTHIGLETAKLDELEDLLWQDVARVQQNMVPNPQNGNAPQDTYQFIAHIQTKSNIVDKLLKVSARRAKLLGLDHETRMRLNEDEQLALSVDAIVALETLNLSLSEASVLINQLFIRKATERTEQELLEVPNE